MRFTALDGMRGVCAVLVALFHFNCLGHLYGMPFIRHSYLFVDFFFVLSGFVIACAYGSRLGERVSAREFILRRIGRVWPLHVFVLGLFVANELVKLGLKGKIGGDHVPFTEDTSIGALVSNLFLVQGLGIHDQLTWNYPSWSISVEFATYLVFALVVVWVRQWRELAFLLLAALGVGVLAFFSPHALDATYDYGFFRSLYGFSLGSLCHAAYARRAHLPARAVYGWLEAGMMGLVLAFVALFGAGDITLGAPVLFAGLVYAMAYERGIFSRLLNTALFQALGRWSYSIYMVHYFLLICLTQGVKLAGKFLGFPVEARMVANGYGVESKVYVFADWWTVDMIQLGYLAAVIAMSAVTYRFIELPFQHAFARRAARKMP